MTTKILIRGETPALKNTPVGSFPVKTGKKLSRPQIVGDFSLIPTSSKDRLCLIGSTKLRKMRITTSTKSVNKGFRVIAK